MNSSSGARYWTWPLEDGLGSVRVNVDRAGGVLESRNYDPYGNGFNPTGTSQTDYGFTGEPLSGELLYLRARYYNPTVGMFTALDPFEGTYDIPMSLNGYSWVEGNVPNVVDPTGKLPLPDLLAPCDQSCDSVDHELAQLEEYRHRRDAYAEIQADILFFLADPEVKEIKELMLDAEAGATSHYLEALRRWSNLVKTGAKLDVKNYYRDTYGNPIWLVNGFYKYDISGNIIYGYIGVYVGFTASELQLGAGAAQLTDHFPNDLANLGPFVCNFDECGDQAATWVGMNLFGTYGINWGETQLGELLQENWSYLAKPSANFLTSAGIDDQQILRCQDAKSIGFPYALGVEPFLLSRPSNVMPCITKC